MIKIKRIVLLQNVSIALGVIAFVISMFCVTSILKVNEKIDSLNFDNKKDFTLIKDNIPDVEVISNDGSVVKVHAKKSEDEVGKLIGVRQEKNGSDNKKNIGKNLSNSSSHKQRQNNNNGNIRREEHGAVNLNGSVNKNSEKIAPMSRSDSKKYQQQQQVKEVRKDNTPVRIPGNFIVQIGAFKDRGTAEKQCQKVRASIGEKQCGVVVANGQAFRAVIYPFATNDSAVVFANKLSNKLNIACLAKKNV